MSPFAHYILHIASRVKYVPRKLELDRPVSRFCKGVKAEREVKRMRYEEMRRAGATVKECLIELQIPKSTAYVWEGGLE